MSYQSPSGSVSVAVFTSAPRPPVDDGSIWYYGNHPHPANHPLGSFCGQQGSHRHDYAPYRNHRYEFHDGHYFWVGDAKPYASRRPSYAYYGHHPHPHYFGGYCRIRGLHQHGYAPRRADYYRMKNGAYFYAGVYGADYYAERNRYDALGWRGDQRSVGYRDHERARRDELVVGDNSSALVVDPRNDAYRAKSGRLTLQDLLARERERTRDPLMSAPANADLDGGRE